MSVLLVSAAGQFTLYKHVLKETHSIAKKQGVLSFIAGVSIAYSVLLACTWDVLRTTPLMNAMCNVTF